jgi:hypothetical protein
MTRTIVAVLGTLAEFHREPIPYNLGALVQLVTDIRPDLLCLDMAPDQWQQRDFDDLPPEYREALLPLAHQTDIVVAPIGAVQPFEEPTATGWRGSVISTLRKWLAYLQRTSPDPAAINEGWRHHVADSLYSTIAWLAGSEAWRAWRMHTMLLTEQVLEIARRDPGCRILVVVNVRHCHHIRPALEKYPEIQVVKYSQL